MPIAEKYLADFEEEEIFHVYNRTNNNEKLFLTDENRLFFLKRYKEIVGPFADSYCWSLLPNHFHLLIRIKSEKLIIAELESRSKEALTMTERKFLARVANLSKDALPRVANLSKDALPRVANPSKAALPRVANLSEAALPRVANLSEAALPRVANLSKVGNPDEHDLPKVGNPGNPEITLSELIEQSFKRFFQSYALAFNKHHNRKGNLFYKPFKRVKIERDSQFTMALIYIHANAAKHGLVKDFASYKWSSWHSITSKSPTSLLRDEVIDWFGNLEECIKAHKELAEAYYDCEVAIE